MRCMIPGIRLIDETQDWSYIKPRNTRCVRAGSQRRTDRKRFSVQVIEGQSGTTICAPLPLQYDGELRTTYINTVYSIALAYIIEPDMVGLCQGLIASRLLLSFSDLDFVTSQILKFPTAWIMFASGPIKFVWGCLEVAVRDVRALAVIRNRHLHLKSSSTLGAAPTLAVVIDIRTRHRHS